MVTFSEGSPNNLILEAETLSSPQGLLLPGIRAVVWGWD